MKVAIRTDASSLIGTGHVMRCKTLADELRSRGAKVRFVCREHRGNLIRVLRDAGYTVSRLTSPGDGCEAPPQHDDYAAWLGVEQSLDADQAIEALGDFKPDWLVVDHYGLDASWESRLRPHVRRIFVIDDLANRPHDCDLLLDQNWFGSETASRYENLIPDKCQPILGPSYALLQPVFAHLKKCLPHRDGSVRRVVIFMGGVDSSNQTAEALKALSGPEFLDLAVDVVIGNANPHIAVIEKLVAVRSKTTLYRGLPSLAGLMVRADLMLGAGGSTTWERCCLGLPSIAVIASENQRRFTVAMAEDGVQLNLGLATEVAAVDWMRAVQEMMQTPAQMRSYSVAASRMTDGLGVCRLAAVMESQPIRPSLRRATREDEALLLEWANDPEVRRHAFSPEPISPETHHEWLHRKLADPDCLLLVGQDVYGLPIGQVRFDCHGNEALIDISVDRALRGRGLGQELLRSALEVLRLEGHDEPVVGEVLAENQASCSLFLRLGFHPAPPVPGRDGSHRFILPN